MSKVEKLFKEKTKELTFIELKKNTELKINGYTLKGGIPLPVITDSLMQELEYGDLSEEISLENVIEGMFFLFGTDPNFPHMDLYREILYAYDKDVLKLSFYKGIKALESADLELAGVFFRACFYLDEMNLDARLNYSLVLESMGKTKLEDGKIEEGQDLIHRATNELETIVNMDDSYSLAYYKLGYHYLYLGQYLKAQITWNKFLTLDKDEDRLQEIREQIDIINDDVKMEIGLSYYSYNDFGKALDSFLKLMPKHADNWNINYLIGLSYKGLEDYNSSEEYLIKAIKLNKDESDLYNDLGIIYFIQGMILEAIKTFTDGIEETEADFKIYFNRGLGYVQLGEYNLALRDINIAYELNPYDENVEIQKRELENYLETL
ncbi:hypothetical protein E9840_11170 [Tissierella creatinini]|nr:hypothetical protein E9840_11170 [Tissierella creatinini]TJX63209.1 hypothetical protein E8P77_15495 [Soehngenia saccharolytica]